MTAEESRDLHLGADALGLALDAEAVARIARFIDLLEVWNRRFRLTGDRDRRILVRKHVVDSLSVVPELPAAGMVVDLGSGGGFPGIVLGCARPDLPLRLIEPRRRPISFLSEVIRTIPLPKAVALAMRGQEAVQDPSLAGQARVVVSRALRLDVLIESGGPLLAPEGILVAMQTPKVSETSVRRWSRDSGLRLSRLRDYRLLGGEPRRLAIFTRS